MQAHVERDQFLALESRFWDAILERDGATAALLSDNQCLLVGGEGMREIDRDTLASMVEKPPYELKDYEIDESSFTVRDIAQDTVAVAYRVRSAMAINGRDVEIHAFDTSVWHRTDGGQWVCVTHTESVAGNPMMAGQDGAAA